MNASSHFVRRKHSKKRRPRSTFHSPITEDISNNNDNTHRQQQQTSNLISTSIPLPSDPTARSRIRAPPQVSGYDHDSSPSPPSNTSKTTYTTEQLNTLRKKTASICQPPSSSSPSKPLGSFNANPIIPTTNDVPTLATPPLKAEQGPQGPTFSNVAREAGNFEDDPDDDEWQKQLLRRAGVSLSIARGYGNVKDNEAIKRDEHIIREELDLLLHYQLNDDRAQKSEDEDRAGPEAVDALEGLIEKLEQEVNEVERTAEAEEEQRKRMQRAAQEADSKVDDVLIKVRANSDAEKFYSKLGDDLEALSKVLNQKRIRMEGVRDMRVTRWMKKAEAVEDVLKNGVDEFGRVRRTGSLGAQAMAKSVEQALTGDDRCDINGLEDVLGEGSEEGTDDDVVVVDISVRNVVGIVKRFEGWKSSFTDEYERAGADVNAGRLIGAVATCETSLRWLKMVHIETQRQEACRVWDVVGEACWWVRAEWQPADIASTSDVGSVLRALWECVGDEDGMKLEEAVGKRLDVEMGAAESAEDAKWVAEVMKGVVRLKKVSGRTVVLGRVLKAISNVGVEEVAERFEGGMDKDDVQIIIDEKELGADQMAVAQQFVAKFTVVG